MPIVTPSQMGTLAGFSDASSCGAAYTQNVLVPDASSQVGISNGEVNELLATEQPASCHCEVFDEDAFSKIAELETSKTDTLWMACKRLGEWIYGWCAKGGVSCTRHSYQ
jgi:hypothetical protein